MYQELIAAYSKLPRKQYGYFDLAKYLGTPNPVESIGTPEIKKLLSDWKKKHPDLTYKQLIALMNRLNAATSFNEKTLAPGLLARYPKLKKHLDITLYDRWLNNLHGWAEIDTYCQSMFDAGEILSQWSPWKKLFVSFRKSPIIAKRRASLVLLCKPVRTGTDQRLADLAFANIETLKHEKDILITKAISWLLRDLIANFRSRVEEYLQVHEAELPRIAVRETRRKLETGRK